MAKRGSKQKSGNRNPKKMKVKPSVDLDDMDDEVDLFHKQKDKIPLDMNDDSADSDEDDEQPVFDYKGGSDDDSEDDDDSEEDDDDDEDEEKYDKTLAKLERTQKYLKAKHGNLEDDNSDDAEEDTEEKRTVWGRGRSIYHDADNIDYELQSSDDGSAEEEEAEVIRLRKETAKSMTMEDFGIEDDDNDESDGEPTLEELMSSKRKETGDNLGITYEEVKKDLSSLSRDEQMDVVSSSAPELVGLLSELNDALNQLDQINPIVSKIKLQKDTTKKEELHYLEVKKLLLLAYCQAITFYLLLKSEGQPVRDHPVIARLVEIKSLLDKTKLLDENLPSQLEAFLNENEVEMKFAGVDNTISNDQSSDPNDKKQQIAIEPKAQKSRTVETLKKELKNVKGQTKHKRIEETISSQSLKMLSTRAALEEKLKQKGIFTTLDSNSQRTQKHKLQRHNSQLETFDDFGDDVVDMEGNNASLLTNKISQLINTKGNKNKVSGDEDLPLREDLGERRRKHELRVLSRAGVEPINEEDDDVEDGGENGDESEDELINLQEAKLAAKNSITPAIPTEPETVDGKRLISQQMEKNRGLTPHRKKLTKNPRKKYKLKHEKAKKRHTGQVRQVRKPEGPYGGEMSGINAGVSRSIRFKG